jgi:hypothetical protein
MKSSLQLNNLDHINFADCDTTVLRLPTINNVHLISSPLVSVVDAKLEMTGHGQLLLQTVVGSSGSLFSSSGFVTIIPNDYLIVRNCTVNITDGSSISSGRYLQVIDNANLEIFNLNTTEYLVDYSGDIFPLLTNSYNLTFDSIEVNGNSRITGSRLILFVQNLILQNNATLSTTALGPFGGTCGDNSFSGQGLGGGYVGLVGGDGGGHGGDGGLGLSNRLLLDQSNTILGFNDDQISLQDQYLNQSTNGSSYGNRMVPVTFGSGGGGSSELYGCGGRGGGVVILHVQDDVMIDANSELSADGQSLTGGGGGGSGGSIWIRHSRGSVVDVPSPSINYHGHILGSGKISAQGGKTCLVDSCPRDVSFPGGFGAGGRIRIEKTMENYFGEVNVRSGASNISMDLLETRSMGDFVRVQAIATLILNVTSAGDEALDIVLTQTPMRTVQVISTYGRGVGSHNATDQLDAVIKGYWFISYRSKSGADYALSSQATASELKSVLQSLAHPDLDLISISRRPSTENGWSWSITFHSDLERIVPFEIDPTQLWCTNGVPSVHVQVLSPFNDTSLQYVADGDVPLNYSSSQLSGMIEFSDTVLSISSFGYWENSRTLRIVPLLSNQTNYFLGKVESLLLTSIFRVPTINGFVTSLSNPYLLQGYEPNWKFPSGQPTGSPSGQPSCLPTSQPSLLPSCQPSCQPTSLPSSQPSGHPSVQPTSQPTSPPTMQPTLQPTSQPSAQPSSPPTCQPTGCPTSQPSRQPTSQPSRQPFSHPTGQPSAQPRSHPTSQPTCQPTRQPSSQPFSRPTSQPTNQPSAQPTRQPFSFPTSQPSCQPFSRPSSQPSRQPSSLPSIQPSSMPSGVPSTQPTSNPTNPTGQPSSNPTNVRV